MNFILNFPGFIIEVKNSKVFEQTGDLLKALWLILIIN